ncbi:MAG: hypothetical protein IMZ67_04375, partial [Acidobacteria bacterium]|nr:hypothetical protein [Acidobacteriota bacterium]
MAEDSRIDRREFMIGGSAALVGAAAVAAPGVSAGAGPPAAAQATFQSPAGSRIPFDRAALLKTGSGRVFVEPHLAQIAFPLGGIGTGTVSLSGRGALRDWEIFNRPNKNHSLPYTFVALRVKAAGRAPAVYVVEGQPPPPYQGTNGLLLEHTPGPAGLPRFRRARFTGAYPLARLDLEDDSVPVGVTLEAFNPFIPLATDDSSIPVAIFRYTLENRSAAAVDVTLAFSILNAIGYDGQAALTTSRHDGFGQNVTRFRREGRMAGLEMTSLKYAADDLRAGSMT